MNKKLLLGLGGIACASAIGGGLLVYNSSFRDKGDYQLNQEEIGQGIDEETRIKIEELYFEELKNKDRYTFCIGKEKITGTYTNTIMGNEKGTINYESEEINLIDNDSQKMYILGRTIDYQYSGSGTTANSAGVGTIEIEENGNLTEYYKKNQAPVRIDYYSKTIFPAPERKINDWVYVNVKMIGTVMGLTSEREETSKEDAKTFCPPFSLSGRPLENGAFITPDSFSFSKKCKAPQLNPGVDFEGDYEFTCDNINYDQGIKLLEKYQSQETIDLNYADNEELFNSQEDDEAADDLLEQSSKPNSDPYDIHDSNNNSDTLTSDDVKKQLEELRKELQADQKSE
ncbi:MAG: hypothetical protein RB292_04850 [Patescibacteria group bacterium]|jgi:hypothetical protein|nr:hypothetical protein [Patescibacteria group bacterium]